MRIPALIGATLAALTLASRDVRHVGLDSLPGSPAPAPNPKVKRQSTQTNWIHDPFYYTRPGKTIVPQNANTTRYGVNGTNIPDVSFDIGESYAGLMPISADPNETRQLYFWFFPSSSYVAGDEITIWLNGGPGCSSLEGLLQENGPFLWQYGTFAPVKNPYTWVNLTNVVWVEQPVGTGFSQGVSNAMNETAAAAQFLGFWKQFVDTFGLQHRKIYITGESYAGYYVPYIADAMFNANNTAYNDVQGIMIYDPSTSTSSVQRDIPLIDFVNYHQNLFHLNSTYMQHLNAQDVACGYKAFRDQYFTFPPPGPMPAPPVVTSACNIWSQAFSAASLINPCFDIYAIATTCPLLWDVLGFPGSFDYLPPGASIYFNRTDVQKAINAPVEEWEECRSGVLRGDTSPPSGLSILPSVIERSKRTIIAHGQLDMILLGNGTLLMIQNMTWGGKQGFQTEPASPFYVPYHPEYTLGAIGGAGVFGTTHTERGLTWVEVFLSGHMIPQYAPTAAYRQLEYLLGRIPSLSLNSDFTTEGGNWGNANLTSLGGFGGLTSSMGAM